MELTKKKQNTPKLWYWGEPKEGMSIEDCEKMVAQNTKFSRENRFMLQIAFV